MNIARNEVAVFQYSSVGATTGENIVAVLGTSDNSSIKSVRITDLKATCGGTARTIQILGQGTDGAKNGQALSFALPANSYFNFSWEMPFKITAQASTGVARAIVASASGAGVNYVVSGYLDN